jgi:hypothetical protein
LRVASLRAAAVIDWRIVTQKCDAVAQKCYKKAAGLTFRHPSARPSDTRLRAAAISHAS